MKWSIVQLQKYRDKDFVLDEMEDMSHLKKRESEIRDISLVHVTGRADIAQEKVTFHLNVSGEMILPCSRTLVDVTYPFEFQMTETYLLKPSLFSEYGDDVHKVEGDVIDITPAMEEEIILAIPMQIFSEDADQHLTPSGKGWEYHSEEKLSKEESEKKVDPRLAALADFFDEKKE